MILITGAAGFIGTNTVLDFNKKDINDLILVDNFQDQEKVNQLKLFEYKKYFNINDFENILNSKENIFNINLVIHLGAITDTTCDNDNDLKKLNLDFSKKIWHFCTKNQIKLIYASSGATYGMGENGFNDSNSEIENLKPLNKYGKSKNDFDIWVLKQKKSPSSWIGLKFFNVYGPHEYNKGKMASVVHWGLKEAYKNKKIKLFKSQNNKFEDGYQARDFIFVNDVIEIIDFFKHKNIKDIFNVGTGNPRTFLDLAKGIFQSLDIEENIEFVEMPEELVNIYQYFTCANIKKLKDSGFDKKFTDLEDGINICANHFLKNEVK